MCLIDVYNLFPREHSRFLRLYSAVPVDVIMVSPLPEGCDWNSSRSNALLALPVARKRAKRTSARSPSPPPFSSLSLSWMSTRLHLDQAPWLLG